MLKWPGCIWEFEEPAKKLAKFHFQNLKLVSKEKTHLNYRRIRRKFPRLKVVAYHIIETWSIEVAYVDKSAKYNDAFNFLLAAVKVLSGYVRVLPMRIKGARDAA